MQEEEEEWGMTGASQIQTWWEKPSLPGASGGGLKEPLFSLHSSCNSRATMMMMMGQVELGLGLVEWASNDADGDDDDKTILLLSLVVVILACFQCTWTHSFQNDEWGLVRERKKERERG